MKECLWCGKKLINLHKGNSANKKYCNEYPCGKMYLYHKCSKQEYLKKFKGKCCLWCGKKIKENRSLRCQCCNNYCKGRYTRYRCSEKEHLEKLKGSCLFCGTPINKRRKGQKYCSKECYKKEHYQINKLTIRAKRFINTYKLSNTKKDIEILKEKLKKGCLLCAVNIVELHKIKENKQVKDIVALCPNHHALFTLGLIKNKELLDALNSNFKRVKLTIKCNNLFKKKSFKK